MDFWPTITPGVTPWVYYVCVGLAVLITGISKSGFGGGIGIMALPIMAAVMPAKHMLGVQLPLLIAADALSNLHHLRNYEWRILKPLVWGALVGVALGSAIFWALRHSDPPSPAQHPPPPPQLRVADPQAARLGRAGRRRARQRDLLGAPELRPHAA